MQITATPVAAREGSKDRFLSELASGHTGVVGDVISGKAFRARAFALGFTPGEPVTVIQNPPTGPMIVLVRGARVALGRGEAMKISVSRPTF